MINKLLEHKRKLELCVVGCAFVNPDAARRDSSFLRPEHFTNDKYRAYWMDIMASQEVTGADAAVRHDLQDEILNGLTADVNSFDIASYARGILDDYYLINTLNDVTHIANLVGQRDIDKIQEVVGKLTERKHVTGDIEKVDLADQVISFLASMNAQDDSIKTGISALDYSTGGIERRQLTMIAARPSMGKSSLMWQIAYTNAFSGLKVLYYSLEMTAEMLIEKYALGEAGASHADMRAKRLTPTQEETAIAAANKLMALANDRLIIVDKSSTTSDDIRAGSIEYKPDLLVVDHTSLVCDRENVQNENLRVGGISKRGKQIAKDCGCAAVYAVQLSRNVETRTSKVPTLSDLRDSGELEQNADTVLFIHRPDYYDPQAGKVEVSPTEIWIGKNRYGMRNVKVEILYNLTKQRFYGKFQEGK